MSERHRQCPQCGKMISAVLLPLLALVVGVVWFRGRHAERIRMERRDTYGLVLSGGCAKGAYEIGVWKAMEELDVCQKVRVISGTSIGAINAALFGSIGWGDCGQCEDIWLNSIESVFQIDDEEFGNEFVKMCESFVSTGSFDSRWEQLVDESSNGNSQSPGLCDASRLRKLLKTFLPQRWKHGPPYVYATALAKESKRLTSFCVNGSGSSRYVDYLMASAAIPVLFSSVMIDDVAYTDGGFGFVDCKLDNVPLAPVRDRHPEVGTVIVVYLSSQDKLEDRVLSADFPDGRLIEIIPSRDIGRGCDGVEGALDFSRKTVAELIRLGYEDAMRILPVALAE